MTPEIRHAYSTQKSSALKRGITWEFCFEDWVAAWLYSGKWEQRGRGSERYCMARKNDAGPYSPANVYITTNRKNSEDFHRWTPEFIKDRGENGRFSGFNEPRAKVEKETPDPAEALEYLKSLRWSDKDIALFLPRVKISAAQLGRIRLRKSKARDDVAVAIIHYANTVKARIRRSQK